MADNTLLQLPDEPLRPVRTRLAVALIRLARDTRFVTLAGVGILLGLLLLDKGPYLIDYAAPSGADPGNWLSLAWGITGESARLASWVYPPFTFILLRGLLFIFPPLLALKTLGILSWVAMGSAFMFVLQRTTPRLPFFMRIGLAVLFTFAGYNAEIFAWGGYPQLLGMAFMLLAVPFTGLWLKKGEKKDFRIALLGNAGVIFTHHMLAAILPVILGIVVAGAYLQSRERPRLFFRRLGILSAWLAGAALLAAPIYWRYLHLLAGNPANPGAYSIRSIGLIIQYLFRDTAGLWLSLLAVSIAGAFILRKKVMATIVAAFILGTLAGFAILWEIRLLQLVLVGIGLGLAMVIDALWSSHPFHNLARFKQAGLIVALALVLLVVLPGEQQQFVQAASYYRVVDNDLLPGLDWLQSNTRPGERVLASRTTPDLIGWWVEGYARRPSLYAADTRWLSFEQEKGYAIIANLIFSSTTSAERAGTLIYANRIRYVFIDKRTNAKALQDLADQGVLTTAFEDRRVIIYKVARLGGGEQAGVPARSIP